MGTKSLFLFAALVLIVAGSMAQPPVRNISAAPLADTAAGKKTAARPFNEPFSLKYNYYESLGAACKAEWKLEKATKIPFRFRLGSLQQTDYLEQKPNAQPPK